MTMSTLLHAGCAVLYVLLAVMALTGKRRDRTAFALSASCTVTALWAAGMAVGAASATPRAAALLELGGQAAWSAFVLHLYHPQRAERQPGGAAAADAGGCSRSCWWRSASLCCPPIPTAPGSPAAVIYARLALGGLRAAAAGEPVPQYTSMTCAGISRCPASRSAACSSTI